MKKIFKNIFVMTLALVSIIVGVITMPIKWLWKTMPWWLRWSCAIAMIVFFLFETITPAYWLALTQYYEARDEPFAGRYAVGCVVLNHVKHHRWPNNVDSVVHAGINRGKGKCDFSYMCDGKPEKPWSQNHWGTWVNIKAQAWLLLGLDAIGLRYDPTGGVVYYKRYDRYSPWFDKEQREGRMTKKGQRIGAHEFFHLIE